MMSTESTRPIRPVADSRASQAITSPEEARTTLRENGRERGLDECVREGQITYLPSGPGFTSEKIPESGLTSMPTLLILSMTAD